jgi:membrane protein implicated in regulation of membrane protease activity
MPKKSKRKGRKRRLIITIPLGFLIGIIFIAIYVKVYGWLEFWKYMLRIGIFVSITMTIILVGYKTLVGNKKLKLRLR